MKVFCSRKTYMLISKRVFMIPKKPLLNSTMRPFRNPVGDWALEKGLGRSL